MRVYPTRGASEEPAQSHGLAGFLGGFLIGLAGGGGRLGVGGFPGRPGERNTSASSNEATLKSWRAVAPACAIARELRLTHDRLIHQHRCSTGLERTR